MRTSFHTLRTALICILLLGLDFPALSHAQTRKPTAAETASIRACATRNKDNLDEGERQCLFNLVAQPCIDKAPAQASDSTVVDCYRIETLIWDQLLNDNYRDLLDTLDDGQTVKARAMQRAWTTYRDTTCEFYDDKIQGSMAVAMHAACETREAARRAMLLQFFSRL